VAGAQKRLNGKLVSLSKEANAREFQLQFASGTMAARTLIQDGRLYVLQVLQGHGPQKVDPQRFLSSLHVGE
jgi:hypothetical protein